MEETERKHILAMQLTLPTIEIMKELETAFCTVLCFCVWYGVGRATDRSRVVNRLSFL